MTFKFLAKHKLAEEIIHSSETFYGELWFKGDSVSIDMTATQVDYKGDFLFN